MEARETPQKYPIMKTPITRLLPGLMLALLCAILLQPQAVASFSQSPLAKVQSTESAKASLSKKQQRKLRRQKRRVERLRAWLNKRVSKKGCGCNEIEAKSLEVKKDFEPKYSPKVEKTVLGVFLLAMGIASLYALLLITLSGFSIFMIFSVASIIIGDSLLCQHGDICILTTLFDIFSFIWWF